MAKLNRKRSILWKVEGAYGTDAGPTGGANAIQCTQPDIVPIEGQTVPRELLRSYLGNSEQLPAAVFSRVTFQVELAGSGTPGTPPAWGSLLRSCGFSQTVLAADLTGTAQAGSADEITLAAGASSTDGAYVGMPLDIDDGAADGDQRTIIAYNGTTKVATPDRPFSTATDNTSDYRIRACTVYAPVSDVFEAATGYFNLDGIRHILLGARGTMNLNIQAGQIPRMAFDFLGIYVPATDTPAPALTFTAWKKPRVVNKVNTPGAVLHGVSGVIEAFTANIANVITPRSLPGMSQEEVRLTDRQPAGTISLEVEPVATKNWFTTAEQVLLGSLVMEHGIDAGNIVRLTAPSVQVFQPRYADSQGVSMLNANLTLLPLNGNDDLFICAM